MLMQEGRRKQKGRRNDDATNESYHDCPVRHELRPLQRIPEKGQTLRRMPWRGQHETRILCELRYQKLPDHPKQCIRLLL